MSLIAKLLKRNTSTARIAGFALSNFLGILIVSVAVMVYSDTRDIWSDDDSFMHTDYMVLNKRVTSANTLGVGTSSRFSAAEKADLEAQPWVRRVGEFTSSPFRVYASIASGGRSMETALFFESVPDSFVDVAAADWKFDPDSGIVPVIIPKDYLTLYNFGFAGSAGLPQLSESLISGIPLSLYMRSEDGTRSLKMEGRIAGFSKRLNTVLVPQAFMDYASERLAPGEQSDASRLIVDVSSPGDVAIADYLKEKSLETAGDKSGSSAAFLLRVAVGIVMAIGIVITLLSVFVLMLSMSLLLEKNRVVIHRLLMLGAPLAKVRAPYAVIIATACGAAWAGVMISLFLIRTQYAGALEALGASTGGIVWGAAAATLLTVAVLAVNMMVVGRKVEGAWRLRMQ